MYAITVSQQHEVHRSLTLNILQGTPQGKIGHQTLAWIFSSASDFWLSFLPGIVHCALVKICHLSTSIRVNKKRSEEKERRNLPTLSRFRFISDEGG